MAFAAVPPPQSAADAMGLAVFLASRVYAPEVAAIIGPLILLVLAAVVGASFALASRPKTTRASAMFYFVRQVGLSVLLTGGAVNVITSFQPGLTERIVLVPVAVLLAAVSDWGTVLRRVQSILWSLVDMWRKEPKQ